LAVHKKLYQGVQKTRFRSGGRAHARLNNKKRGFKKGKHKFGNKQKGKAWGEKDRRYREKKMRRRNEGNINSTRYNPEACNVEQKTFGIMAQSA